MSGDPSDKAAHTLDLVGHLTPFAGNRDGWAVLGVIAEGSALEYRLHVTQEGELRTLASFSQAQMLAAARQFHELASLYSIEPVPPFDKLSAGDQAELVWAVGQIIARAFQEPGT